MQRYICRGVFGVNAMDETTDADAEIVRAYERRCSDVRAAAKNRSPADLPTARTELVYQLIEAGMADAGLLGELPPEVVVDGLKTEYDTDATADMDPADFWNALLMPTAEQAAEREWGHAYDRHGRRHAPPRHA